MPSSEVVAEALFRAHAEKATGWLTCVAKGRTSRLALRDGDLVRAELQFGFRAPLQGLLQAGRIELAQLDALWARGEAGRGDAEALDELGVSQEEESTRRLLSGVRRVAQLAEKAHFEPGEVDGDDEVVDGAQVVRTAFEAVAGPQAEAPYCKVTDAEGAARWAVSPQERELLESFTDFKSSAGLTDEQRVLFEVLKRSGVLEALSPGEFERREAEAEAQRQARLEREDEERRVEEERIAQVRQRAEEARVAEQQRQEEARLAEEKRKEEARLAEEQRQEEERQAEARRLEEARLAEEKKKEEARLAEEQRQEEARKEEERRLEAARVAEEARLAEEARHADEERREVARLAEEKRLAEEQRKEDERKAEAARVAEAARLAEEARKKEERRAVDARLAEERQKEEAQLAEQARLEAERLEREEAARAEAERKAEAERQEEARRAAEAARLAEEQRRQEEEARLAEEKRKADDLKAEEARLAEEMRLASERRAEAARQLEARLAADREAEAQRQEEARRAEEKRRDEERRAQAERLDEAQRKEEERRAAAARAARPARPPDERAPGSRPEVITKPDSGAYAGAPGQGDDGDEAPRGPDETTQPRHKISDTGLFRMQERDRVDAERARAEAADRAEEEEVKQLRARASAPRPSAPAQAAAPAPAPAPADLTEKRRTEDDRLARLKREAEELALKADARRRQGPTPSAPTGPAPSGPVSMAEAVGGSSERDREILQKHHEKDDLLRRMNEALRRTVSSQPGAAAPAAAPAPLQLSQPASAPPGPRPASPMAARIFGGDAPSPGESDLWKLVDAAPAAQPGPGATSFEEALRRVDSTLEQLVSNTAQAPLDAQMVEPIIEAELESPAQGLGEEDDLGDPSDPADAARQRRLRLLRKAMENMGSLPPRSTPSGVQVINSGTEPSSSQAGSPPPTAAPGTGSSPSGVRSSGSSPGAVVEPSVAEKQLAAQIEARFAALSGKRDHFAILGVAESATKDQIKGAFLNLAKVFHPDRLPASIKDLAQKMSSVFEAIREAYEVLSDDQKRAAWLASQKASAAPPPPTPSAQATELYKVAEAQFKKRDFKNAEESFARAHALDHGAPSLAGRAWCIYMDPTRKGEAVQAKRMMAEALKIDPSCDRAHYQLGVISRVEGEMDRAEKHFREAVAKNPKHLEAAQELRLIEMRKKKGNLYK